MKQLLRRLLPAAIVRRLRELRMVSWPARGAYLRLQARRALGGEARDRRPLAPLAGTRRIVFVCHGNIIRSPMGEAMLRGLVDQSARAIVIESAGTHAIPGRRADDRARALAARFGVSLERHTARLLTDQIARDAELIFVMDRLNESEVVARFPFAAPKVRMLGAFALADGERDCAIPDPFLEDEAAVGRCYERLKKAVEGVARELDGKK
ncbi:MAG: hypothetical protein ACREON_20360 [Gemmatimonadaceae bacterium]